MSYHDPKKDDWGDLIPLFLMLLLQVVLIVYTCLMFVAMTRGPWIIVR